MEASGTRLAELLGSLSLATDGAAALPPETAIRTALVSVRIAALVGTQGFARAEVYWVGLLRFLGCSAYAHELAPLGAGDDLALLRSLTLVDPTRIGDVLGAAWRGSDPAAGTLARVAALARLAANPQGGAELFRSHCELAITLARQLGMADAVVAALGQAYERHDGKGSPAGLRGDEILPSAKILHVAWRIAAHHALVGPAAALAMLHARRGGELDPQIADLAIRDFDDIVAGLDRPSAWQAFLDAEPKPVAIAAASALPELATAFACFADVKSPWTTGHSLAVAERARRAARHAGVDVERLGIAALLHDIGRVAVPNGIWDKRGVLDAMERERMRVHAWETERILSRSPLLLTFARLAAADHERVDGGGYPKGLPAVAIDREARLLAACDVYQALREDRPHRRALSSDAAAAELSTMAREKRLCAEACDVVLADAGHVRRRAELPASLSARELEVIRGLVRGDGNKQIAAALHISASTVKRHLENVFAKTGLRTRAALAVWALQHDLL